MDICFYRGHENAGKVDWHFCANCDNVCLKVIFSLISRIISTMTSQANL